MAKKIPIEVVKKIANDFDYDQVLIFVWNRKNNKQHITTFGKSIEDCDQIAQGGNYMKKFVLGWPDNKCCAEPNRVKRLMSENFELKERLNHTKELLNLAMMSKLMSIRNDLQ